MNNTVPNDLLDDLIADEGELAVAEPPALDLLADSNMHDNNLGDIASDEGNSFVAGLAENSSLAGLAELGSDDEAMVLTLDDLFPDENGEVVIFTEDGLPINLIASLPVDQSGVADPHVTAAGIDVGGLSYHTFESGLTVYFEPDSLVQITDTAADV